MEYFVNLGVNPKAKDKLLQTPIYYTARDGKYKCTEYLISCGAPLNEKDFYLQTPIYYASRENQIEIVKLLIKNGSNLNEDDKYGQTCLFYAIKEGHYNIVELLINEGAEINRVDKKKHTPYTYALKYNHTQIAQLLHSRGAIDIKPDIKDKKNKNKKAKIENKGVSSNNLEINENLEENIEIKPKKYVLISLTSDGHKRILSNEEIEEFKKAYADIASILYNEKKLQELENDAPER